MNWNSAAGHGPVPAKVGTRLGGVARYLRDLMTERVVTVRGSDTVATATQRMTRYGFSALPVVSPHNRLLGMVSLLDVIRYREAHEEEGLVADEQVPVSEIMNPDVLSMAATASVAVVARRLADHGQLRVLPVTDGAELVGVVTRGDLLRTTIDETAGRLAAGPDRDATEAAAVLALARHPHTGGPTPGDSPVSAVMTHEVVAVTPDDPIMLATRVMLRDRHPSLPVVGPGNRLIGIISEADILADPLAGRRAHGTVGSVMSRGVISIGRDATVGQARSLLAEHGLRHLPVVDAGILVGVLSRSDLI